METISLKVDELTNKRLDELAEKGEFKSKSEVRRVALMDFPERRQIRWREREEARAYFKDRSKISCGEIIEMVREEDDEP